MNKILLPREEGRVVRVSYECMIAHDACISLNYSYYTYLIRNIFSIIIIYIIIFTHDSLFIILKLSPSYSL